jgi:hypothetical protein
MVAFLTGLRARWAAERYVADREHEAVEAGRKIAFVLRRDLDPLYLLDPLLALEIDARSLAQIVALLPEGERANACAQLPARMLTFSSRPSSSAVTPGGDHDDGSCCRMTDREESAWWCLTWVFIGCCVAAGVVFLLARYGVLP